jgi:hypothetical protein
VKNGILVSATQRTGTMNGYKNIGDYIQSLAQMTFFDKIDDYVDKEKISQYKSKLEKVKVIMNAWYMVYPENWPPSDDIIPLLISMHISPLYAKRMLSESGIEYLKRYGPVGCRDKGTVELLQQYNIPCYFSGCLTLTLGEKYKIDHKKNHVIFVDPYLESIRNNKARISLLIILKNVYFGIINLKKIIKLKKMFKHYSIGVHFTKIKEILVISAFYKTYSTRFSDEVLFNAEYINHSVQVGEGTDINTEEKKLAYAEKLIKKYAEASLVVTSRIHCALPCLGLETPVIFVNSDGIEKIRDPNRLDGLVDLFRQMDYRNFCLNSNDELLKNLNKINSNTVIYNKQDYPSLKEDLIRKCYAFALKTVWE